MFDLTWRDGRAVLVWVDWSGPRVAAGGGVMTEQPKCHECGRPMVQRRGPRGEFWGCSRYPRCRATLTIASAVRLIDSVVGYGGYSRDDELDDTWGYDDGGGNEDGRP